MTPVARTVRRASAFLAVALASLSVARPALAADEPFFFRDGDRAMILGDSITQQQQYSALIETYTLSRFPKWKISFRNTGWGADTMGLRMRKNLDHGFDRDLKPLAPTAVTIDFGMNDARNGTEAIPAYVDNARKLTEKFAAIGARVAFITSSPEEKYETGEPAGSAYNHMLRKYSEELRKFAEEKKLPFINQLEPFIALIEKGREAGVLATKERGTRLIPDNVHPNWDGSFIMAVSILKGLNAPADVSAIEINAATGSVRAGRAKVTEVKTGETLTFTRLDDSMPWPVPAEVMNAHKLPGFTPYDDLSRYLLKVTNLSAPRYQVAADGKVLGTYTKEELAAGVNLTGAAFKNLPEVKALFDTVVSKNVKFYTRWREVKVAEIAKWIPADVVEEARAKRVAELDAEIAQIEAKIDSLRAPQPHVWTVSPVR